VPTYRWPEWTTSSNTVTEPILVTVTTGSVTWPVWNQEWWHVATNTTASTTWLEWNQQWVQVPIQMRPPSNEEQRRRHQEYQARQQQQQQQRGRAQATALALLAELLSEDQLRDHQQRKFFDVVADSGRRYRILTNGSKSGNVRLMVGDQGDVEAAVLCAHLYGTEPTADSFIAQKLALEDDEEGYLAIANVSRLRPGIELPRPPRATALRERAA